MSLQEQTDPGQQHSAPDDPDNGLQTAMQVRPDTERNHRQKRQNVVACELWATHTYINRHENAG